MADATPEAGQPLARGGASARRVGPAVACILGGSLAPASNRQVKWFLCQESAIRPRSETPQLRTWPEIDITFGPDDHPRTMVDNPQVQGIIVAISKDGSGKYGMLNPQGAKGKINILSSPICH